MADEVRPAEDPEFEDIVAALLKVDPEGITGQKSAASKAKAAENEEDPAT